MVIGLFLFVILNILDGISLFKHNKEKNILCYKNISTIKVIIGNKSIALAVDDPLTNEWALYYLRDVPVYVLTYRLYMAQAHVVPFMHRSTTICAKDLDYVLTDKDNTFSKDNLVWSDYKYYYLWKIPKNWISLHGNLEKDIADNWKIRLRIFLKNRNTLNKCK